MKEVDSVKIFNKIMERIERLHSRLEAEVAGLACAEILRHARRIEVLKKNIDKLSREDLKLRHEYQRVYRAIRKYHLYTRRLVRTAVTLIVIIALIMAFSVLENNFHIVPLPSELAYIFENPLMFPVVMTVGASLIVILVVLTTFTWISFLRKYNIHELKKKELDIRRKYHYDVSKRLNILRSELEKSMIKTSSVKTIKICRCYEEFSMLYNMMKNLSINLRLLRKCKDQNCIEKALNNIASQLNGLKDLHEVCNTVFTQEYYVSIEFNGSLQDIIRNLKENLEVDRELKVKIRIRNLEYEFDLGEIITSALHSTS